MVDKAIINAFHGKKKKKKKSMLYNGLYFSVISNNNDLHASKIMR